VGERQFNRHPEHEYREMSAWYDCAGDTAAPLQVPKRLDLSDKPATMLDGDRNSDVGFGHRMRKLTCGSCVSRGIQSLSLSRGETAVFLISVNVIVTTALL
jgi:hypothetical protein